MLFFQNLLEEVRSTLKRKIPIVVCAEEDEIMEAIFRAQDENIIISPILIGESVTIKKILDKNHKNHLDYVIVEEIDKNEAAKKAIELLLNREGDFLVKGLIDTSILLKAVLNSRGEIADKNVFFSHVTVVDSDFLNRVIIFSDGALNILPSVKDKIKIIENCYKIAKKIGIKIPKISLIAAKEKVSPKMIATIEAEEVKKYFENDVRFIVEGPLALDNAISQESAHVKKLKGQIQGDADILIMPNIEAGNIFYKTLSYFSNSKLAGVLVGGEIPIVVTSRADNEENKFLSIVLATAI